MAARQTIVRCKLNRFDTPLFSFDIHGIYIRCKDCRDDPRSGGYRPKRGVFHLVPWSYLMKMMLQAAASTAISMSFGDSTSVEGEGHGRFITGSGGASGSNSGTDEGPAGNDEYGERDRDQGRPMDESEVQVSGLPA